MELLNMSYRRSRMIRLTAGVAALFILVGRLGERRHSAGGVETADAFIWGTTLVVTVLLLWREHNQATVHRKAGQEHSRFIVAAESSLDAFFIFDAVRGLEKEITGFRFRYVNCHAEKLLKTERAELLDHDMTSFFPTRLAEFRDKFRGVVASR
jgi:PAS domain-containing protein